jgi:predicted ATPase/class 3 adenylate cyclase
LILQTDNSIPFIEAQNALGNRHGHFFSYTMFIDISGFTALTAQLMQQGKEGAEVLSNILNDIFGSLVQTVYESGGFIPHFAGDAFMSIFPSETNSCEKVLETAFKIRHFFEENPIQSTRFGNFRVKVRIGMSFGKVEWGLTKQNVVWFRGQAIDNAAEAQRAAQPHEMLADVFFKKQFDNYELRYTIREARWLLRTLKTGQTAAQLPLLSKHQSEFRQVVSVFILVEENAEIIDYQRFNLFAETVIDHFQQFSGYFKEIDFGDKGALLVGFFGAPVAFENNEVRALEFALSLKKELSEQINQNFKFKIGLTTGLAYAGEVGGVARRQYAIAGKSVNLAARMVQNANWGDLVTDAQIAKNQQFIFEKKSTIHYKGFVETTNIYQLLRRGTMENNAFTNEVNLMVGRDEELNRLHATVEKAFGVKKGCVCAIFGEAGAGKSRLVYELKKQILIHQKNDKKNIIWLICQCDRILRKPFNPFIYGLKNYFKQSIEYSMVENRIRFDNTFKNIALQIKNNKNTFASWQRMESILAALMGLPVAADSLWEQLDAKGRHENTLSAFHLFFEILSKIQTVCVELEDVHWADDATIAFLQYFVPNLVEIPIALLMTARFSDEGLKEYSVKPHFLKQNKVLYDEVELKLLEPNTILQLIENQLKGKPHPDLAALLQRVAHGNPFYVEQMLAYFKENNLLKMPTEENPIWQLQSGRFKADDLKILAGESIQAILTARIDRLSDRVKETVKAAAVIGRAFELPILNEVMLSQQNIHALERNKKLKKESFAEQLALRESIKNAEKGQIWRTIDEVHYIFRHTLLREAVYEMQLKNRVRHLHGLIAKAIQKVYKDALEERFIDLAFHYEQAEEKQHALIFLRKAASQARLRFQNQAALDFYDRQLKWLNEPFEQIESAQVLLEKGAILQLTGKWQDAAIHFYEALDRAEATNHPALKADSIGAIGQLEMLKGNYQVAKSYLETALQYLESSETIDYQLDKHFKNPKSALVLGHLGNLYFRQGAYPKAETAFLKSITLFQQYATILGRVAPQIVSNLGLTYMNQGNYESGVLAQKNALHECEQAGDTAGKAILSINIGIVYSEQGNDDAALTYFEQGLNFAKQLNNKQLVSIVVGCIGNVHRLKGDLEKAATFLEEDMRLTRELGDRQGIAIACELLGKLHSTRREWDIAYQYLEQSLLLCRSLSYRKGIAKALHGLGEILFAEQKFVKAIEYFDEAINISKQINNQLILGQCLIDKSKTLFKMNNFAMARRIRGEAISVAAKLGNERLNAQLELGLNEGLD